MPFPSSSAQIPDIVPFIMTIKLNGRKFFNQTHTLWVSKYSSHRKRGKRTMRLFARWLLRFTQLIFLQNECSGGYRLLVYIPHEHRPIFLFLIASSLWASPEPPSLNCRNWSTQEWGIAVDKRINGPSNLTPHTLMVASSHRCVIHQL